MIRWWRRRRRQAAQQRQLEAAFGIAPEWTAGDIVLVAVIGGAVVGGFAWALRAALRLVVP